jgi:hypothetical protein
LKNILKPGRGLKMERVNIFMVEGCPALWMLADALGMR